jgi:hypothetical protein
MSVYSAKQQLGTRKSLLGFVGPASRSADAGACPPLYYTAYETGIRHLTAGPGTAALHPTGLMHHVATFRMGEHCS